MNIDLLAFSSTIQNETICGSSGEIPGRLSVHFNKQIIEEKRTFFRHAS